MSTFKECYEAAKKALAEDHLTEDDLERLSNRHWGEIEHFSSDEATLKDELAALLEKLAVFRLMEKEFVVLKSEIEQRDSGRQPSSFYVGHSVGIITEQFREVALDELPFEVEDIIL